jgi:ankyrin repeat protein
LEKEFVLLKSQLDQARAATNYWPVARLFGDTNLNSTLKSLAGSESGLADARRFGSTNIFAWEESVRADKYYVEQAWKSLLDYQELRLRSLAAALAQARGPEDTKQISPSTAISALSDEDKEIRRIQVLIQTSPDLINAEDSRNATRTPLINAASAGWLKVAAYLLDHGTDVNRSASDVVLNTELQQAGSVSPLLAAVSVGNKAMTQFLIEHGANVNFKGENNGVTSLHLAARKGFQAVAEVLIANHADVNAKDKAGQTPLFAAVQGGQIKIIQMLIAAGAKPNLKDVKDNTVLNFAIKTSPEMFKTLLAAGTDPNTVDAKNRTPLSYAVERDSLEVVKMLLAAKADPNGGFSDAPLLVAIHQKDVAAAEVLLQAGANPNAKGTVDLSSSTFSGGDTRRSVTPLALAVSTGQLPVAQLLLKFKADPNDSQTDGKSLLFSALGNLEILTALLNAGATVDVRDATAQKYNDKSLNWTPLIVAVQNNSPAEVVGILLQHGANPNLQDDCFGDTALGWSAGWGFQRVPEPKVLELLLEHQADPNIRNSGGMTLLIKLKNKLRDATPSDQIAINKLADLLRQHGAQDTLPNWDCIAITRPSAMFPEPVYYQGTNGWNRFTLLEALLNFYGSSRTHAVSQGNGMRINYSAESILPFPDLSHVIVVRPSHDGTNRTRILINLLNQTNGIDGSKDIPLEFGDVVEIPEREHALGDKAVGLTDSQRETLFNFLKGSIRLVVRGQTVEIPIYPCFDSSLSSVLEKPEARNLLLSSSDLSQVKVTRHDPMTGKNREWILNCRPSPASLNGAVVFSGINQAQPPYSELWLRSGDVIEVPEKP